MRTHTLFACVLLMSGLFLSAAEREITVPFHGGTQTFVVADDFVAVPVASDAAAPATVAAGAEQKLEIIQRTDLAQRTAPAAGGQRHEQAVLFGRAGKRDQRTATILERSVAVKLAPGTNIADICRLSKSTLSTKVSFVDSWFIVMPDAPGALAGVDLQNELQKLPGVECAEVQTRRPVTSFGLGNDPLLDQQYHLSGDGPTDVHASAVWNYSAGTGLGAGVRVNVVDGGVESHPDLRDNLLSSLGQVYVTGSLPDPDHGTFVSGLIAGVGNNAKGGSGIAPRASIIPVTAIEGTISDDNFASAIAHRAVVNDGTQASDISNNSWGSLLEVSPMSSLFSAAMSRSVTDGRSGRGMVYVFAAGNYSHYYTILEANGIQIANGSVPGLADFTLNLNYRGPNSSRWVIPVGAIDRDAKRGRYAYSESGAGLMCVAAGGKIDFDSSFRRTNDGIVSLDRTGSAGFNPGDYTATADGAAGTSFAAPIVSGVVALMLEANPELTYRDVQHIIARHSIQCDPTDEHLSRTSELAYFRRSDQVLGWSKWQTNHASPALRHSVYYGFGKVDAALAVSAARNWVLAPKESSLASTAGKAFHVPANGFKSADASITAPVQGFTIEHVELHVEAQIPLQYATFLLTSPGGSTSYIEREPYSSSSDLNFTFTSVAHWGENPAGKWTLKVLNDSGNSGTISKWSVQVFGHQPYPTPAIASISPTELRRTGANQSITITGSGFARNRDNGVLMTRFRVGSEVLRVTGVNSGTDSVTVTIPPALLVGTSSLAVVAENPDFNSQFSGTPGTFATVTYRTSAAATVAMAPAPVITVNPSAVTWRVGADVDYQIQANPIPNSYGASPLPAGLVINTTTGRITGQPTTTGSTTVTLTATNGDGTGSATLTVNVQPALVGLPVVTSATSATARVGVPFTYTITATNTPTEYVATGLPVGWTLAPSSGTITGTPVSAGQLVLTIGARNALGDGPTKQVVITVNPALPVITSAKQVAGVVSKPFSYTITATATGSLTFTATGLPAGLAVDASTGIMSGTPQIAQVYPVIVRATDATGGVGSAELEVTISPAAAQPSTNGGGSGGGGCGLGGGLAIILACGVALAGWSQQKARKLS